MFKTIIAFLMVSALTSCHTTTYYFIRHAEKENTNVMTSDVPLSPAGLQRAVQLKNVLKNKNIHYIYSTNYSRTLSTIEPLRKELGLTIRLYDTRDTLDRFIDELRSIGDGNVLVVGHANTVPAMVNKLAGRNYLKSDLPDTAYDNIFIVAKTGRHYSFKRETY